MRLLPFIYFFFFISGFTYGQRIIQGHISNAGSPLSNVHVINLSSGDKTASNEHGYYQIKAEPREELEFTYMGMDTISIIVEDVTQILNIKMTLKIEELDEVTVSKTILKGQNELESEYHSNPNIIKSSFGFINRETSSFPVRIIDEEEIERWPNLNNVIMGMFAGVTAFCDPGTDELYVKMRSTQSLSSGGGAIFDVDGLVLTKVYCSQFMGNLKRIAFISSLTATSLYGSLGAGGVVVINTKTGTTNPTTRNYKPYNQALIRNNYIKEGMVKENGNLESMPVYLENLRKSESLEQAKTVFGRMSEIYGNHPYYLLDSYVYFYEQREEEKYADGILERFVQIANKNPVLLKSLAYVLESEDRLEKAHEVYKNVYILRPDYAQSFIDMANSYRDLDRPESAASLYLRHSYLLDEGLLPKDSLELPQIMQREIDNLFALEKGTLSIRQGKQSDQNEYTTRLVFEWNDSEAEFDLQFVNPNGQYFEWKHTLAEMSERIRSEKKLGYSMVDFLLDDEIPGTWKVNATYHGNKQLTPSYLKATIYRNYGGTLQSKEVKVFRLWIKGANQYLFDLKLPSEVVHN